MKIITSKNIVIEREGAISQLKCKEARHTNGPLTAMVGVCGKRR